MNLLHFPVDVLLEIAHWLDGDSLAECLLVSKSLRHFLKSHPEFEYAYRLEKQGMVNTCNTVYSYDDRIRILKRYVRSWSSNIERTPTQLHHIDGECIAYELVAGVFVKTDGLSLTIQWLPSPSTDAKQLIRPPEELLIPIKDFALDPTQDLIVMIQADLLPLLIPQGREIRLHLRTLSTNVPHPDARNPILKFNIPFNPRSNDLSSVTIQLATDLLSLFFSTGPGSPHLLLWDWRTGNIILNSMNPGLHLPSHSRSYELLGPRSFAIFSTAGSGCIYIYNIRYPNHPIVPPFCVAKFNLPSLLPGIQLTALHSHTGPFLGRPRQGGIFTTTPESRVYVITARFLGTTTAGATFFVEHSAFLPYILMRDKVDTPIEVPWETWSRHKTFFAPMQLSSNWLRYVQGTRVLVSLGSAGANVAIFDFNMKRGVAPLAPTSDYDLFETPIDHILPPMKWTLSLKTSCASFMIDEDFILGLQTSGHFEERIRSLEVFSMYERN